LPQLPSMYCERQIPKQFPPASLQAQGLGRQQQGAGLTDGH
jgi:hypothetical protein